MNDTWVCKDASGWNLILRRKDFYAGHYFITSRGITKYEETVECNLKVKEFSFIDPTPLLPMEFLQ